MTTKAQIISMIDTEQTLTRRFDIAPDGKLDFTPRYRGTRRMFRPNYVQLYYRVNRGAGTPFWYCFSAKVRASRVLKGGAISEAVVGQTTENYTMGPTRGPETPEWLVELAVEYMPTHTPEDTAPGV